MNQLQVFNFSNHDVRVVTKDGQPWWVAKDVCDSLEMTNSRMTIDRLDEDEKGVSSIYTLGGTQQLQIVNEAGLYTLILSSRKPEAKQFKRWITHEVLPTIRKHGMYATDELLNNPDFLIAAGQKIKEEQAARRKLELQIEADRPKVIYAEALETSTTSILVRDLAKLLKQNGFDIGGTRLFAYLRENGYLIKKLGSDYNMPTQKSMDLGLFEIKTTPVFHNSGQVSTSKTPKVTSRGQEYFLRKFLKQTA